MKHVVFDKLFRNRKNGPPLFVLLSGCSLLLASWGLAATQTTMQQSVQAALDFSPQLRSLAYGRDAARFDLEQSQGGYYPSIDVLLGYGPNQYSDRSTRLDYADPGNEDWSLKTDASLRFTQQLYDGGETAHSISARRAELKTAKLSLQKGAQITIFETVRAHLNVIRQQQIVRIAEKDLAIHKDMCAALAALAEAGSGDIADLSQVRARIAWAESNLTVSRRELEQAISVYRRLVGHSPGKLSFEGGPKDLPHSLSEVLLVAEQKNPTLLISSSKVNESEARVNLAKARYFPRVNLELSSSYKDNVEGEDSWRQSHEAMLVVRWNLFNGGQDRSAVNAARARSYESRLDRTDNLGALQDTVRAAWMAYTSLHHEEQMYQDATLAGKQTLTAYMEQFSVARRSLLDVLNAEREFVQSAQKAIATRIDKVIAAYYILQLEGELQLEQIATDSRERQAFEDLLQRIEFPAVGDILLTTQYSAPAPPLNIVHLRGLVIENSAHEVGQSSKSEKWVQVTRMQLRPPIIASTMDESQIWMGGKIFNR